MEGGDTKSQRSDKCIFFFKKNLEMPAYLYSGESVLACKWKLVHSGFWAKKSKRSITSSEYDSKSGTPGLQALGIILLIRNYEDESIRAVVPAAAMPAGRGKHPSGKSSYTPLATVTQLAYHLLLYYKMATWGII